MTHALTARKSRLAWNWGFEVKSGCSIRMIVRSKRE